MTQNLCCGRKLSMTFMDAGPDIKLLVLLLLAAAVTALVVWFRGRRGDPARISEQWVARLGGWRAGLPLLSLAGAAHLAMNSSVAAYAYPEQPTFRLMAPGLAEMAMVLSAGMLAGGLAALAHASLSGRIAAGRFRADDREA